MEEDGAGISGMPFERYVTVSQQLVCVPERGSVGLIEICVFNPSFQDLPELSLLRCMSFLNGPELARLCSCARFLNSTTNNRDLWSTLLNRDLGSLVGIPVPVTPQISDAPLPQRLQHLHESLAGAAVKAEYVRQWNILVDQKKQREIRRRWERDQRMVEARARKANSFYEHFHFRCVTCSIPILLLVTAVLVALRLDDRDDVSTADAFTPIFVVFGVFAFAVCTVCLARWRDGRGYFADIRPQGEQGCVPWFLNSVIGTNTIANIIAVVLFLALVTFCVFLYLRVAGFTAWSYGAVFSPFWATLLLTCATPFLGWFSDSEQVELFLATWVFGLLPLLVFTILLVLRLDGDDSLTLQLIFIPFWVVDGLFLCVPLFACTILVCVKLGVCARVQLADDEGRNIVNVCFLSWIWFVPPAVFQIMLTLDDNDEGDHSFRTIFAPLLLWLSMLAAVGLGFACCVRF